MRNLALLMIAAFTIMGCAEDEEILPPNPLTFSSTIFTSNNTDGNIRYYSVNNSGEVFGEQLIITSSTAADGVYFDDDGNDLIQASRSSFGVDLIEDINKTIQDETVTTRAFGVGDMESPRETAVNGDFIVVADNADVDGISLTPDGRFFVYARSASGIALRNTITTNFKVWGITFIGNDLYAVVDADNELAVFKDFLNNTNDASISPDKRVEIEGIVRTHGLTFDSGSNTMIMTDIGDAGNTDDDGGFHIIENFSTKFDGASNGGMIQVGDQIRVSGSNTLMGNPVDVAYDSGNDVVYIAEIGNGGGRLLSFKDAKVGGNLVPTSNTMISKISCVYLND